MTTIGIDFGTTNSAVAQWTASGPDLIFLSQEQVDADWEKYGYAPVMPSVYASGPEGEALFGFDAFGSHARFEAVKRLFTTQDDVAYDSEGNALLVEEVATLLFAELLKRTRDTGADPERAVITIPANSRGLARHRTKICAGMGGVEVLALINEPTAAAMAYGAKQHGDRRILVFDWGGGTLDVTVLRAIDGIFVEEASAGLPRRGGIDFDGRLRRAVLDKITGTSDWSPAQQALFNRSIELAKIQLSELPETVLSLPDGRVHPVSRAEFETATKSLVEDARAPIERCLADLGLHGDDIDSLLMVGGTSSIPAVRNLVAETIGREPESGVNPMTAVAEGAAIAAAVLTGEASDRYDFLVTIEHSLGTVILNHDTLEQEFSELIPRNSRIPCEATEVYQPVFKDQESVRIRVIEGDPAKTLDDLDNVILTEFDVDLPEDDDPSFDLTYKYDRDGILKVSVSRNGEGLGETVISFGPIIDRGRLAKIAKRAKTAVADGMAPEPPSPEADADPESSMLVQRALVNVLPFLDDEEAAPIRALVTAVQEASDEDMADAVKLLKRALVPYSYLWG